MENVVGKGNVLAAASTLCSLLPALARWHKLSPVVKGATVAIHSSFYLKLLLPITVEHSPLRTAISSLFLYTLFPADEVPITLAGAQVVPTHSCPKCCGRTVVSNITQVSCQLSFLIGRSLPSASRSRERPFLSGVLGNCNLNSVPLYDGPQQPSPPKGQ